MTKKLLYITLVAFLFSPFIATPRQANAQAAVIRGITFPVIGNVSYYDDFGVPRSGGRTHEGNDLMGKKMLPLVAAVDGTVSFINYPQASWGYAVGLRDSENYQYWYLHVNNDNPGTDDGKGGGFFAYAPDIQPGNRVVKGQLIGWMGDSGNAESTTAHLHFELHSPDRTPTDAYQSLKVAPHVSSPVTDYPAVSGEILPYGFFTGGAKIAAGNLDSDKQSVEVVTVPGPGGGPLVRIFKRDGTALGTFYAYMPRLISGIDVAAGDVDGDGVDEIITAPGPGGGPHIRIFKLDGTEVKGFYAYDPRFTGGVSVAAADLDGDGKAEIITGPGKGGGPHIKVFKADGTVLSEFFAYDPKATMGIDVAAAPAAGSVSAAIITAPGLGGGPHVRVFTMGGVATGGFMAYDPNFRGGVRVSAGNVSTSSVTPEILTAPASAGGPHVRMFDYSGVEVRGELTGFEEWWNGGYDIAAANGTGFISSGYTPSMISGVLSPGTRRASVRQIFTTRERNSDSRNFPGFPKGD